jgi:hypothetical protein
MWTPATQNINKQRIRRDALVGDVSMVMCVVLV